MYLGYRPNMNGLELDKERVKGALRENVVMHKKKLPETYSLYGFPFTFQVINQILTYYVFLVVFFVLIVLLLTLLLHF